ncbi:hypothetical protein UM399_07580 [Sulfitobacter pontiacus]|uniref:hypothetical protein n=1 Tax=Sulfitobacter pontiacus TaxID=60137 RepID=UPI002AC9580D|nr:hypothetical protein [Sulfitobacter pontiacus]WPZ24059.1 hypothetical protein UM399_07580 [Sulfitobacter pontiacus]
MNSDCFGAVQLRQMKMPSGLEISKTYDLVLTTLSWEQRAPHAFVSSPRMAPEVTAIWFESTSQEIDRRKAEQLELLQSNFDTVGELRVSKATEIEPNFEIFRKFVEDRYSAVGRPLKVLIDISCMPKNYLLFLLGLGFVNDYFACFDCVYSAGNYDLVSKPEESADEAGRIHRALTSKGDWTSRQLPFFGGRDVFPKSRDLLVSMGGELGLAVPFVTKTEPRKLTLVYIEETAPSEERDMLESEKLAFRELMAEPSAESQNIGLNDSLGVARYAQTVVDRSDADCVSMMVLGAKSHALAFGVVALANDSVEIISRVPFSYNNLDVSPTGEIYFYEIEDRFEPLNYAS